MNIKAEWTNKGEFDRLIKELEEAAARFEEALTAVRNHTPEIELGKLEKSDDE